MKRKSLLLLGIALVVLVGCSENKKEQKSNLDDKINLMVESELTTLNTSALLNSPDVIIHSAVFEGLYALNDKEELEPAVATELPDISEDGITYTIKLRDNATWSNGEPVTAGDFEYAFKELVDPDNGYVYSFLALDTLKNATEINNGKEKKEALGVKALDETTLEIVLEKPTPYFTSLLTFPPFFPQHEETVEKDKKKYGTTSESIVSNGPFVIKEWEQNKNNWTLEKNDTYWDKDQVKAEKIGFEVIKEPSTAFNLFESGQLDIANLSGELATQNKDNPEYQLYPTGKMNYIRLNQKRNDKPTVLANENLRKALALGIDKELLVNNIISDGSTPLYGAITKGFVSNPETKEDFRDEAGDLMTYDLKEAQAYFKKAQEELGEDISVDLLTVDESIYQKMAESIQGQLQDGLEGLKINVQTLPTETALNLSSESDYDMFLIYWTPDYQDPVSTLNTLKSPNNRNYSNETYDSLLDSAATTYALDEEKRWETLIEAEKVVMEDTAGMIVISQNNQSVLQRSSISGAVYHTYSTPISLKNIQKNK